MTKKKDSDLSIRLVNFLISRTDQAFKSQNIRKSNKAFDLLRCSQSFFESWIHYQHFGNMSIQIYGCIWKIDHYLPLASFNLLDEK